MDDIQIGAAYGAQPDICHDIPPARGRRRVIPHLKMIDRALLGQNHCLGHVITGIPRKRCIDNRDPSRLEERGPILADAAMSTSFHASLGFNMVFLSGK
jgi:hypothetical protein